MAGPISAGSKPETAPEGSVNKNVNKRWAVLIGLNFYQPGSARPGIRYPNLGGCISDIELVSEYLEDDLQRENWHISKLIARGSHPEATEREHDSPTYENILRELETVTKNANRGDFVYIHYSGHGARARTLVPEIKGHDGIDEALATADINAGGRYLRDFEIAVLLKRMVDKKLHVTVVFDCCHSGGLARNRHPNCTVRGTGEVDRTILPSDKSDIPECEVHSANVPEIWRRNLGTESFWLEPQGYAMIAAALPHETAIELPINKETHQVQLGHMRRGILTYWLIDSLRLARYRVTHDALYRRVSERVRSMAQENDHHQTPVLMGNSGRRFFLSDLSEEVHTVVISEVHSEWVRLRAGRVQVACKGDLYGIYSWDTYSRSDFGNPLAKVRISKVFEMDSEGVFVKDSGDEVEPARLSEVTIGCHAVLLERPLQMQTGVKLVHPADASETQKLMLRNVQELDWEKYSRGITPLKLVSDGYQGETPVMYHVTVNQRNQYELRDASDTAIPNLPLCNTPNSLLAVIVKLARFWQFRDLKNKTPSKHDFTFQLSPEEHYNTDGEVVEMPEGQQFTVQFENRATIPLYLSIFNFNPLWGIDQVHPTDTDYEVIDWGYYQKREIKFCLEIPQEIVSASHVVDTLKAFVTTKPTSLRSLGMSDIGVGPDPLKPADASGERLLRVDVNDQVVDGRSEDPEDDNEDDAGRTFDHVMGPNGLGGWTLGPPVSALREWSWQG